VLFFGGASMGAQYFAGYVTEKALSVDNLFVFLVIMTSFRVPRADQQKVLLFGIGFSLVARTGFIFLGATLTADVAQRALMIFGRPVRVSFEEEDLLGLALTVTPQDSVRPRIAPAGDLRP
jgi:predicted tellurium resistance membrane protein TerC